MRAHAIVLQGTFWFFFQSFASFALFMVTYVVLELRLYALYDTKRRVAIGFATITLAVGALSLFELIRFLRGTQSNRFTRFTLTNADP